jgi:hypothetical protein
MSRRQILATVCIASIMLPTPAYGVANQPATVQNPRLRLIGDEARDVVRQICLPGLTDSSDLSLIHLRCRMWHLDGHDRLSPKSFPSSKKSLSEWLKGGGFFSSRR